jgi:phage gp36-like protein
MSNYFSTEASIKAKVRSLRVNLWGDKDRDGSLDTQTLTQALTFAKSTIMSRLYPRYTVAEIEDLTTTTDTDLQDAAGLLKTYSDDLVLYYLASGSNVVNPIIKLSYDTTLDALDKMECYKLSLPGISDTNDYQTVTETLESDYDTADTDGLYVVRELLD